MADEINTGGGAPSPDATPKVVALENFQAVLHAKTNLEQQVGALKTQLQSAVEKAATADALTTQLNEWKAKAEKAEGKFQTYTEFSPLLGTTSPKVIGIFDSEYSSLPEADRPTRKAWVEALRATPEAAPEHLAPWLNPTASSSNPAPVVKPPQPKVPGTPATPPGAPAAVSAQEIARVRKEAESTGVWTEWIELRKAMGLGKKTR